MYYYSCKFIYMFIYFIISILCMLIHNIFRSNIHCVSAADDMLVRIFIMVNFYNSFTPIYISCSRTYMYLLFDLFWRSSEAINLVMVHFTLISLQCIFWSNISDPYQNLLIWSWCILYWFNFNIFPTLFLYAPHIQQDVRGALWLNNSASEYL